MDAAAAPMDATTQLEYIKLAYARLDAIPTTWNIAIALAAAFFGIQAAASSSKYKDKIFWTVAVLSGLITIGFCLYIIQINDQIAVILKQLPEKNPLKASIRILPCYLTWIVGIVIWLSSLGLFGYIAEKAAPTVRGWMGRPG